MAACPICQAPGSGRILAIGVLEYFASTGAGIANSVIDAEDRLYDVGSSLSCQDISSSNATSSADSQRAGLITPCAYVTDKPQSVRSTTTSVVETTPLR